MKIIWNEKNPTEFVGENINPVVRQDNPAESGEARPTCFAPARTGVNGGDEHD